MEHPACGELPNLVRAIPEELRKDLVRILAQSRDAEGFARLQARCLGDADISPAVATLTMRVTPDAGLRDDLIALASERYAYGEAPRAYADAARHLGVPLGTLKSRLHRARRILKRQLRTAATEHQQYRDRPDPGSHPDTVPGSGELRHDVLGDLKRAGGGGSGTQRLPLLRGGQ